VLGELTEDTVIEVIRKTGSLKPLPSRVETDNELKGTKRIIVRQGNVYIGKGRKDNRSIIIIPILSASPTASNTIANLLLLNISFREEIPLPMKRKALGGKYEHIVNIVQENSIVWEDEFLERVETEDLFGRSAEKISESIINQLKK
jgi:glucosamine--fructose-6-phosphate aminotransferase (isomerizing)